MKRFLVLCFAVAAMLGFLLAFGGVEKAYAQGLKGSANEEYIAVACMGNLEYFSAHKYAWKWMGDKLGVKTSYIGPAEYDVPGQIAAFDQAIARKPAGIITFGVEASLKPSIDKAVAAGIPGGHVQRGRPGFQAPDVCRDQPARPGVLRRDQAG